MLSRWLKCTKISQLLKMYRRCDKLIQRTVKMWYFVSNEVRDFLPNWWETWFYIKSYSTYLENVSLLLFHCLKKEKNSSTFYFRVYIFRIEFVWRWRTQLSKVDIKSTKVASRSSLTSLTFRLLPSDTQVFCYLNLC